MKDIILAVEVIESRMTKAEILSILEDLGMLETFKEWGEGVKSTEDLKTGNRCECVRRKIDRGECVTKKGCLLKKMYRKEKVYLMIIDSLLKKLQEKDGFLDWLGL